jgi:hypothetical protein
LTGSLNAQQGTTRYTIYLKTHPTVHIFPINMNCYSSYEPSNISTVVIQLGYIDKDYSSDTQFTGGVPHGDQTNDPGLAPLYKRGLLTNPQARAPGGKPLKVLTDRGKLATGVIASSTLLVSTVNYYIVY